MKIDTVSIITQIIGYGVFLWAGLYLLVRAASRTPLIVLSILALFTLSLFFAANALTDTLVNRALFLTLERWLWWSAVLPAAFWLHLSSIIARHWSEAPAPGRVALFSPAVVAGYLAAAVLIAVAAVSNLLLDYVGVVRLEHRRFYLGPGVLYPAFILYLALTTGGALVNFLRTLRRIAQMPAQQLAGKPLLIQQFKLLSAGALLFLVGALWLSCQYNWQLHLTGVPGDIAVFVGLAVIGYGIAHFGMLLEGQNIRRDFVYHFTGLLLLNLLYVGLLLLAGAVSVGGLLLLIGLVTLTHTAFDSGRMALDKLFFNADEQAARAEARAYATTLGITPVPPLSFGTRGTAAPTIWQPEEQHAVVLPAPTAADEERAAPAEQPAQPAHANATRAGEGETPVPKAFKDTVRKALTGLKSPPKLAKSPLLTLNLVGERLRAAQQPDNRLNRAAVLREVLIEQIEALSPNDDETSKTGDAWRFYNVLYYPYVREISRKYALSEARRLAEERRRSGQREPGELEQVLVWLADVDENTFYKWQRRASDTIAAILWEQEQRTT
jgi:hypothetical protein